MNARAANFPLVGFDGQSVSWLHPRISETSVMRFATGRLRKKEHPELTMHLTFDEAEDIFRGLQFWASRDDVGEEGAELELSDDDGRNLVILNFRARPRLRSLWGQRS